MEDKYKHPSIQFAVNEGNVEIAKEEITSFSQKVYDLNGEWISFIKRPIGTEEELVKIRKAKPKNLNLNDLNPVVMRGWIDYRPL